MHDRRKTSQAHRILVGMVIGALLLPAVARAQEAEAPAAEVTPPETHWYDGPVRVADATVDVLIIRPAGVATLMAGAILFVPAALLTIPNGRDSIGEAYSLFVKEPLDNVWGRPLGEF